MSPEMPEKYRPRSSSRHSAIITLEDMKERLDIAERMFSHLGFEAPAEEDGWQGKIWKRRSGTATERGKSRRTTSLSGNRALVKGIYVIAMGLR